MDATLDDVAGAWRTIRTEIAAYGEGLEDKSELVALNKADALDPKTLKAKARELKAAVGHAPYIVSGVSGQGVTELLRAAFIEVKARRAAAHLELTSGEDAVEWGP